MTLTIKQQHHQLCKLQHSITQHQHHTKITVANQQNISKVLAA
ncbi:hypothetical protein LOK49_LG03G00205 [Camellia lanceoleosa]|uniref:Uncharacterized protein n=1 Tax=Camellia lanceoleosa TaxID=1840588 RepID=A0ACC0IF82_9ERIC|nr:hypothetical protein LOK49_LG03G00205 [Camellia lanceoleosa]